MSSVIKFTPLSGCYSDGPLCYLLQMDDIFILFDCGWDERFDINDSHIQQLKKLVGKIDIILLSHSDISHVGALPYLCGQLGLFKSKQKKATIFGTLPVCKMGTMTMYNVFQHLYAEQDFNIFNLDDVDTAFDSITQLKYSQRYRFKNEKGSSLTIVPFCAGHSLGGTVWKIVKETDEIVYAVDYNHRKERHLNGAVFESLGKPSILITDAYNATNNTTYNKAHEKKIISAIQRTLRADGSVLMPVDTASRSLEIALLLESAWKEEPGLATYPIVFLSSMSYRTLEFASHQLEWMSESVKSGFDERRENPFQFSYITTADSIESLARLGKQPKVILATLESLEHGFARELFIQLAQEPRNLVLFTGKSTSDSLARKLIASKETQQQDIELLHRQRVPLAGQELQEYNLQQQKLLEIEKRKKDEEKRKKAQEKVIQIRDEDQGSDDEDMEDQDFLLEKQNGSKDPNSVHARLFLPENMRYHSHYLMFPCIEQSFKSDIYGEHINVEELKNRALQVYESEVGSSASNQMDVEEDVPEIPTKCISETIILRVKCMIEYVDFEGRANAKSIQNILKQINAHKLLIVHGEKEPTQFLANYCTENKISERVEAPTVNETLEVTMDTNMFKVKLRQDLLGQISFVQVGVYELGYLQGEYQLDLPKEKQPDAPDRMLMANDEEQEDTSKMPSICTIDPNSRKDVHIGHNSVFIGDVKLSQFFDILIKNGVKAEFIQGGHLVCNDSVILRRDGKTGQITLDGSYCADYFRIRSLLYSQYQIL